MRKTFTFNLLELFGLISLVYILTRVTIFATTATTVPHNNTPAHAAAIAQPKSTASDYEPGTEIYIPRAESIPDGLRVEKVRDSLVNKGTRQQYKRGTFYKILD